MRNGSNCEGAMANSASARDSEDRSVTVEVSDEYESTAMDQPFNWGYINRAT